MVGRIQKQSIFVVLLLLTGGITRVEGFSLWDAVKGAAIGAGAIVGGPLVLAGVGFTGAGKAAGSAATGMMSAAAIANGGGVATGSAVAVMQSVGAAGFAASTKAAIVSTTTLAVSALRDER